MAHPEPITPGTRATGTQGTLPLVATAIHAGHDLRPEVADLMALDAPDRLREEDPHTDRIAAGVETHVLVRRSRFEVDLNRPPEEAVYLEPEHCWGLDVWKERPHDGIVAGSLELYDRFYAELAERLDPLAAQGPFVVFDVHSYNHRREGPDGPPAPQDENPDVNVGTGSMDRGRWAAGVDTFLGSLHGTEVVGRPLDVRENVRFRGANLCRWVHERYPDTGCALALEFKKTFMDEWTGEVDQAHLAELSAVLAAVAPVVADAARRGRP